jgi:hypothetical protein
MSDPCYISIFVFLGGDMCINEDPQGKGIIAAKYGFKERDFKTWQENGWSILKSPGSSLRHRGH